MGLKKFQSTRPRGARLWQRVRRRSRKRCFNPRARGGRDFGRCRGKLSHSCFNPRARGGRDAIMLVENPPIFAVSIHAPAGGATCLNGGGYGFALVSIHAPAGGATEVAMEACFELDVSIHAPAGGATFRYKSMAKHGQFQSTRPRGARPGA